MSPTSGAASRRLPRPEVCERALDARDARFDGLFFVGITTTGVYYRPVCPARVSYTNRRRFFDSAASAEQAGFRPCLRCRPELAPGRAPMEAVSRLARVAADRIAAGGLNGHSVADLAGELGVSERHLRRAFERELGVSPLELALTHRLLLAKQLLADTSLSVTRIAFASGFQSLRRFNSVFRERYRLCPSALRRSNGSRGHGWNGSPASEFVPLTLSYRPPLAWSPLLESLTRHALPGAEVLAGTRYARTVCLDGRAGVLVAEDAAMSGGSRNQGGTHLKLLVSASLVPVLMPLLARVRRLFDLDAEPTVIDTHLKQGGLGELVARRPGVRMPGVLDGFEAVFRVLARDPMRTWNGSGSLTAAMVQALGEPIETGFPELTRLTPTATRVAEAGTSRLTALGLSPRRAHIVSSVAQAVADGELRLEPGAGITPVRRALLEIDGVGRRLATAIVMRAMYWPDADAFPASDRTLQSATGLTSARSLRALADRWRPWRAYAALHLRLAHQENHPLT